LGWMPSAQPSTDLPPNGGGVGGILVGQHHPIGTAPFPQTFVPIDLRSLKFSNNHLIVNNSPHQLKYSQLPIVMLAIGSWTRTTSGTCGDLLARFSFHEEKFTWEIQTSSSSFNRIDISFDNVQGLGIESVVDGTAIFTVETIGPAQFYDAALQSHGSHIWKSTDDFTGGEATKARRHSVQVFSNALSAPLEFLLGSNMRLNHFAKLGLRPEPSCIHAAVFKRLPPAIAIDPNYFQSRSDSTLFNSLPHTSSSLTSFSLSPVTCDGEQRPASGGSNSSFSISNLLSPCNVNTVSDIKNDSTSWVLESPRSRTLSCGHFHENCNCAESVESVNAFIDGVFVRTIE